MARIANNIMALNTHNFYTANQNKISKSAEKLSSGYRVNRAGDDAAGLAISEKMRSEVRGLNMAKKNSQDGVSLVQTAEGALQEVHAMLQRMSELAIQAANGTNDTKVDTQALDKEFKALQEEIKQIGSTATFNDMTILNGDFSTGKSLQVGTKSGRELAITIAKLENTAASALSGDISTHANAKKAIDAVKTAINSISDQRAELGAIQNRLEYKINNLSTTAENVQAAESRIRDVDIASEMTNFTKNNILSQAATAMLAQANSLPQNVLSLLR